MNVLSVDLVIKASYTIGNKHGNKCSLFVFTEQEIALNGGTIKCHDLVLVRRTSWLETLLLL